MKLGLLLGYWGAGPDPAALDLVLEVERLGFDSVWTAEAYGSDALTPLAWYGAHTSRLRLGTAVMQMSARAPTAAAGHRSTTEPPAPSCGRWAKKPPRWPPSSACMAETS